MLWYLLSAGFMKQHVIPLWLGEELKAAQRVKRPTPVKNEQNAETENKEDNSEMEKVVPDETTTWHLRRKMKKIIRLLAQTLDLELQSSVRHGVTLPTSFPFRHETSLALQQLAFLQKSLLGLAAKADADAESQPRRPLTTPDDEQRWQRVQLRKRAVARFYSGLVLRYARVVLGMAARALSGPLFEKLAQHRPTAEESSTSVGASAATPEVPSVFAASLSLVAEAAKELEAGTTTPPAGTDHRATPNDLIKASFVGTLLPTLITSLCGRASNAAFVSTLLPELVPLIQRVDQLGSLLPQTARSEKAVFSVLTQKQLNAGYPLSPLFRHVVSAVRPWADANTMLFVGCSGGTLPCARCRASTGRWTSRRRWRTSSGRASPRW